MAERGRPWLILFFLVALLGAGPASPQAAAAMPTRVYVIPVAGDVEPGLAAFLKRALAVTGGDPEALIVLELDTFGGRVDSALEMVEALLEAPKGKTVAFVRTKAISAGALIALACNELVMRPNTTIGDCAPITYSEEGPKVMGEKFQSPLRAKFRTLARRNGYPEALAEAMVTPEMTVLRVELPGEILYLDEQAFAELDQERRARILAQKTVVAAGELLTMDDTEALELGFSRMTAASIEEMLDRMGFASPELVRIEPSWAESLTRLIGSIAPILLIVGLGALYTELKAPGFGVPGIIGIVCLGLVFFNQYLVGLADYTELLLLALGAVLLGIELFVTPGFGMVGLAGLAAIVAGVILSFQNFVLPDPELPWQGALFARNLTMALGASALAFLLSLLLLRYLLPRLGRMVEGPYLAATLRNSRAAAAALARVKAGDAGTAVTLLRPAGKVKIGAEILDVVSEGELIEQGAAVVVAAIKGNRIIVRRGSP